MSERSRIQETLDETDSRGMCAAVLAGVRALLARRRERQALAQASQGLRPTRVGHEATDDGLLDAAREEEET